MNSFESVGRKASLIQKASLCHSQSLTYKSCTLCRHFGETLIWSRLIRFKSMRSMWKVALSKMTARLTYLVLPNDVSSVSTYRNCITIYFKLSDSICTVVPSYITYVLLCYCHKKTTKKTQPYFYLRFFLNQSKYFTSFPGETARILRRTVQQLTQLQNNTESA